MAVPAVAIVMDPGALAAALPALGAIAHLVLRGGVVAADLSLLAPRQSAFATRVESAPDHAGGRDQRIR